jgi:hypothetical protein
MERIDFSGVCAQITFKASNGAFRKVAKTLTVAAIILTAAAAVSCKAADTNSAASTPPPPPVLEDVDKSGLIAAIALANKTKNGKDGEVGVVTPEPQEDPDYDYAADLALGVKFVTPAQMATLQGMIDRAMDVRDSDTVVQTEVHAARDALLQAITNFQLCIGEGTNADISPATNLVELFGKISEADALNLSVYTSPTTKKDDPWVSPFEKYDFQAVIATERLVAEKANVTQQEAREAIKSIDDAITALKLARKWPKEVTFDSLTPEKLRGITTSVELVFSEDIGGGTSGISALGSVDVDFLETIGGVTTILNTYKAGSLQGEGDGVYKQSIQNVTENKQLSVRVRKGGYVITPDSIALQLEYAKPLAFLNAAGVVADGSTTAIELTFSGPISGFSANDISVSGVEGVKTAGSLDASRALNGIYMLTIEAPSTGVLQIRPTKNDTVNNNKYDILPAVLYVDLNYSQNASFNSAIPHEENGTTTLIALAFSRDIDTLTTGNITITPVDTEVSVVPNSITKRTDGSIGIYDLSVNVEKPGIIDIAVSVDGITFPSTGIHHEVIISRAAIVNLQSITANNNTTTGATESITMEFRNGANQADIDNLSENDIILAGIGSIRKGSLVRLSAGIYKLPISAFTSGGPLEVTVEKQGYSILNSPKTVVITCSPDVTFLYLWAENNAVSGCTESIVMHFSQDIALLSENDITISGASIIKGALSNRALGVYSLGVSGFNSDTNVTVSVSKENFNIANSSMDVLLKYPVEVAFNEAVVTVVNNVTYVTLTLDRTITGSGLSDDCIELAGIDNIQMGPLVGPDADHPGVYKFALNAFSTGGTLDISLKKTGYNFSVGGVAHGIRSVPITKVVITPSVGCVFTIPFNQANTEYSIMTTLKTAISLTATVTPDGGTVSYALGESGGTFGNTVPSITPGVTTSSVTFRVQTVVDGVTQIWGPYTVTIIPQ